MKLAALKTWMIAGAIALGGGTAALATSDVELTAPEGIVLQEGGPGGNFQFTAAGENEGRRGNRGGQELGLSEEARTFLSDEVKAVTAETLGVTVEELEAADREGKAAIFEASGLEREDVMAAVEAAWPSIVQEAESSGLITAEQAETLTETGPRIGGQRGRRGGQRGQGNILPEGARAEIMAEALGISVEELETYREDGLKMNEIIEELGLDADEVKAAAQEATIAAVEQAAADGTITQEQADRFIEAMALRDISKSIRQEAVLQVLGITAEDLEAYRESGLDMEEILADLGLEEDAVREDIRAATEALVQQAVEDGTITEEQAEQLLNGRRGRGNGNGPRGNGGNAPTETGNNA